MMVVRGIMSTVGLLIIWLTYRIARLDHDRFTSLLCALVLSFSVLFIQKTIEIRPDQFLVILWLASFWICLRSFRLRKNGIHLIAAGALLGMGMLFTPKALLCFAAVTLTFAANSILRTRSPESKGDSKLRVIRDCLCYTLGFLVPIAACALFFWQNKSLGMLIDSTILDNLDYPNLRRPTYLLSLQHIVLFLIAFAGMIVCLLERNIHRSIYRSRFLIGVACTILMFYFLFFMPAPFQQSALIFVPFLAIFGGIALKKSLEPVIVAERAFNWKQKSFLAFTLLTAVLIPCGSLFVKQPTTGSNADN